MKYHPSTRKENHFLAFLYLLIAFMLFLIALWTRQNIWYLPVPVFIIISALRLFWLDKKLK